MVSGKIVPAGVIVRGKRNEPTFNRKSFWCGFFCAVFLFTAVIAAAVAALSVHGVTVSLGSEEVASMVRERVVTQAQANLPKVIAEAKLGIPAIVAEEMKSQFDSDRMEIAGFVFRMPEELMEQLKAKMQVNVENATGEILDGIDTGLVAEQFGDDIYMMVRETMQSELHGQSYRIMVLDRVPLRLRIIVR